MAWHPPAGYSPPGSWTRINRGTEAIRSEIAERMGICEGQTIRGDVLVTARVRTNEELRREAGEC